VFKNFLNNATEYYMFTSQVPLDRVTSNDVVFETGCNSSFL